MNTAKKAAAHDQADRVAHLIFHTMRNVDINPSGEDARQQAALTFLLTDVEGNVRLWENDPAMPAALARHDALGEACIRAFGGNRVKDRGEGDSLFAVFESPEAAVAAACAFQRALHREPLLDGFRVRMAVHHGPTERRDGDYYGPTVNRCARLRDIAHGGQVLVSRAVREHCVDRLPDGATLREMGAHRLRDLSQPEQVYQLLHPEIASDFPPLRSLSAFRTNLPVQITAFVGREHEIATLTELLSPDGPTRLVTLLGPGGSGKTRLALQVAAALVSTAYPDGVWFVELDAITDASLVPQTVAATLGVREQTGRALLETLTDHLSQRTVLVVLDNGEHVIDACAGLAETLVARCPNLRILATSREAMNVPGEVTLPVPPLPVPDPKRLPSAADAVLERVAPFEAVTLFVERARLARPDFALTAANAAAIAEICYRLDGIPLLIELAAARVRVLSVPQIAQNLYRVLSGGSRTRTARQQTVTGVIDWSWQPLSDEERRLFRRLSVFAGGWTLDAAEAVCGDDDGGLFVPDLLWQMVAKSLVVAEDTPDGGESRYRFLETVRYFSAGKLTESGEETAVRDRHRDWAVALAERAETELRGADARRWLDCLEAEHDNLRAALRWSVEPERRLRLASSLWRFWYTRGYLREGRDWIEGALSRYGSRTGASISDAVAAKGFQAAGNLAWAQGDLATAQAFLEKSLALRERLGDRPGIAVALNGLGLVARQTGDLAAAAAYYEQSLDLHTELGMASGIASCRINLAGIATEFGDYATTRRHASAALEICRETRDIVLLPSALHNLAVAFENEGDFAEAERQYQASLAARRTIQDRKGLAVGLQSLASVGVRLGRFERAATLLGASAAARNAVGLVLSEGDLRDFDDIVAVAREQMDPQAFQAAWERGEQLELGAAVAFSLDESDSG